MQSDDGKHTFDPLAVGLQHPPGQSEADRHSTAHQPLPSWFRFKQIAPRQQSLVLHDIPGPAQVDESQIVLLTPPSVYAPLQIPVGEQQPELHCSFFVHLG